MIPLRYANMYLYFNIFRYLHRDLEIFMLIQASINQISEAKIPFVIFLERDLERRFEKR